MADTEGDYNLVDQILGSEDTSSHLDQEEIPPLKHQQHSAVPVYDKNMSTQPLKIPHFRKESQPLSAPTHEPYDPSRPALQGYSSYYVPSYPWINSSRPIMNQRSYYDQGPRTRGGSSNGRYRYDGPPRRSSYRRSPSPTSRRSRRESVSPPPRKTHSRSPSPKRDRSRSKERSSSPQSDNDNRSPEPETLPISPTPTAAPKPVLSPNDLRLSIERKRSENASKELIKKPDIKNQDRPVYVNPELVVFKKCDWCSNNANIPGACDAFCYRSRFCDENRKCAGSSTCHFIHSAHSGQRVTLRVVFGNPVRALKIGGTTIHHINGDTLAFRFKIDKQDIDGLLKAGVNMKHSSIKQGNIKVSCDILYYGMNKQDNDQQEENGEEEEEKNENEDE